MAADTDLFGKVIGDLQTGIQIKDTRIGGSLNYIADYTDAGFDMDEGHHFLVLHCTADSGAVIKAEVLGGYHGEVTLDSDGILISQLHANTQGIKVQAIKDGMAETKVFSLKNLTLEEAE